MVPGTDSAATAEPETAGPTTAPSDTTTSEPVTTSGPPTEGTTAPATTEGPTTAETESTTADPSTTSEATTDATSEPLTATDTSTTAPPASCGNGVLDPGEACDDGNADETDACTTLCNAPSCSDGLESGDESDLDCGGSCGGCAVGQGCGGDGDCLGGACEANQCVDGCVPWARQWGTQYSDGGSGIAVDGDDNIFVSSFMFAGNYGAVRKYDAAGQELWTRQIDSSEFDGAYGVATDSAGNVFVTGDTQGDLDGNISQGYDDVFIVKYDNDGNKQWTRQFGSDDNEVAIDAATDAAGNVIVAGNSRGSIDGHVLGGVYDVLLAKYDAQGEKQWIRQFGSSGDDQAYGVTTDSAGNIIVVGYVYGSLDGNVYLGDSDAFVAKFDADGTKLWTRQFGLEYGDYAAAVATDDAGDIYVTGSVSGSLDGNPYHGFGDLLVMKFDADGAKQWTRQLGTSDSDAGRDIVVDGAGDLLIGGSTDGDFDGHVSKGGWDLFVAKYSASGVKQWTHQLGTVDDEHQGFIAALSTGMPVIVGYGDGKFAPPALGVDDIIAAHLCLR
ncbi:SBBP repeat-containing protein [Nannocystis radixulma]|uniref:SBBP repeat-containing protein n=1 Tax=Nannocystis radixulma TaxID=2995305 RepID=A0ABT5BIP2_9BACT|nr:SBBP repeat-containing protein [Nannocystis radixulma]MDC0673977.1 SBBP repeat-containing protein [Nannocystis radixulma]